MVLNRLKRWLVDHPKLLSLVLTAGMYAGLGAEFVIQDGASVYRGP